MKITLDLPFPPSTNAYWRSRWTGKNIIHYIAAAGITYRREVKRIVGDLEVPGFGSERLEVVIRAYPPDLRNRDLDNLLKSCLDALQEAKLFDDDEQIDDLHIIRGCLSDRGSLHVTIQELPHEAIYANAVKESPTGSTPAKVC